MPADFREIDTGETATSFTLTLVDTSATGSNSGGKGAGGGNGTTASVGGPKIEESTEIGDTQSVSVVPDVPAIVVSTTDLQSDIPEGRHGEPFQIGALFQGCELEDGKAYCGFHAAGAKLRAFYNGPTPEDMLYALEDMPLNSPVMLTGDQVETRGMQRAVVFRAIRPQPGGDPHATLRTALQGDWVSVKDVRSEITIRGSEIYVHYDGEFKLTRFMELAERCDGMRGS